MIHQLIQRMIKISQELKQAITDDIEDVKLANHEKLLERNEIKLEKMQLISDLKEELNQALVKLVQNGGEVDEYRQSVDELEVNLKELYTLNGKLASIVLPVKELYKDIIDEITKANGGTLVEVRA